jgi:hypothetical protein
MGRYKVGELLGHNTLGFFCVGEIEILQNTHRK